MWLLPWLESSCKEETTLYAFKLHTIVGLRSKWEDQSYVGVNFLAKIWLRDNRAACSMVRYDEDSTTRSLGSRAVVEKVPQERKIQESGGFLQEYAT